jgi:putative oxidoreductase
MAGTLFLIGRILFVLIFISSGVNHIMNQKAMGQYAKSKGVPMAEQGVLVSGIAMIIGSLLIVLGLIGDLGALIILVTLVPTTYFMHPFWKEKDPQMKMTEMINFNKNLALIGASIIIFVLFASDARLPLALTSGVLNIW